MIITETDPDFFYASLIAFDWENAANLAIQRKISLQIMPFSESIYFVDQIKSVLLANKWQYLLVNACAYKHTNTDTANQVFQGLFADLSMLFKSHGFIEDEQISLAHSFHNVKNNIKFFAPIHKTRLNILFL